ncbi:acyl-CoA carboxylase subunit epsilon [Pengzhenrongella sicca]|uniref:Acyl-CoA carboxylase subunit epsilon n=1 Tax=Pengzhenrongella sicca TaxID=2819238 RepID=A0A8A4ZGJ8_9MICO|nr:acyl-CoA carboxylase subunit epsilon [Pengzhenrongella sicca]QTE28778.1 acyl-CoA carboxylase subunit epsilon [Pengzhenrongella sicca]
MTDRAGDPGDGSGTGTEPDRVEPARVQVVRGEPDDLELAALVAGLVAVSGEQHDDGPAPGVGAWSDRTRTMRPGAGAAPGPDTWRWSLHP